MNRFTALLVAISACIFTSGVAAEYRIWSAASGSFTTDAEYLGKKSDTVIVLRRRDGVIIDVALEKLSPNDQAYVASLTSPPQLAPGGAAPAALVPAPPAAPAPAAMPAAAAPAPVASAPASPAGVAPPAVAVGGGQAAPPAPQAVVVPKTPEEADRMLKAVDRDARLCRSPDEALDLYSAFLADQGIPAAAREAAQRQVAEFKKLADQKLVRLGPKWVTREESLTARKHAVFLINQGLEMVRLNQDRIGFEKLLQASKVAPDDIQADFIIATVFAIAVQKFEEAEKHYKVCLSRDPTNPAVLNNLALVTLRQNKPVEALGYWRQAAALCKDKRIVQNIGKLFEAAGSRAIFVPAAVVSQLSDIYAALVIENNVSAAQARTYGWQYMVLPQEPPLDETVDALPADETVDKTIHVCGTGFCIASEYILTTRASTRGAAGFLIADPNQPGKRLEAMLTASAEYEDLAVLHCPDLKCRPLPIDNWGHKTDDEVLVAAYPLFDTEAKHLKVARGRAIRPSQYYYYGRPVYDIPRAPSVPGGPIVDSMGNVLALSHRSSETLLNRYITGIGVWYDHNIIPNYRRVPHNRADQPWDDIQKQVAQACVVIMAERPAADVGLNKRVGANFLVDNSCMRCNGSKTMRCPARGCSNGKVSDFVREITGQNPVTGQKVFMDRRISVACKFCSGDGRVRCDSCGGSGQDNSVDRSQRGIPIGAGGSASPTTILPGSQQGAAPSINGLFGN